MPNRSIVVLGAGVAGMAAALLLARDGHRVTVLERDELAVGPPEDAPGWERQGIPHFRQPHAFIPRGRIELMRSFPEVYEEVLAAGGHDVDVRPKLPGPPRAEDEDLQYLAARRPLIEWALRRAIGREPLIDCQGGAHPSGLVTHAGRVHGVRIGASSLPADLVLDALGRRSPVGRWLSDSGHPNDPHETSDCGVVYYSRYYRQRPGFELPDGPWLLGPRGDLGYLGFTTFPGDNRTFAVLLAVPSGVPQWRAFKEAEVFEAAVARIPGLRAWVDPEGVDPITGVMAMAGLRNSVRASAVLDVVGCIPVGDAYGHTDPVLAHGLAFGLIHADALASALREQGDVRDAQAAYLAATGPALRERYELATALDDQRHRFWLGEPVDFAHHDGAYALFSLIAGGAAAAVDAEVCRVFARRLGLLDSTTVLDQDTELQRRIETLFAELRTVPRPPAGPTRDEMIALTSGVVPS